MPKWIHQRADHILSRNPSMPTSEAFSIATQQSHALGKSPKNYGTLQGREAAKAKYKTPEDDKKTASEKTALIERLVRLGATDVPGTPRLLMRHRSPQELAQLQHGVQGTLEKIKAPLKAKVEQGVQKLPGKLQKPARMIGHSLVDHPETIALHAAPVPGLAPAWIAAKKGRERGIDRFAPAANSRSRRAPTPLRSTLSSRAVPAACLPSRCPRSSAPSKKKQAWMKRCPSSPMN